jgi:hypothetical protein
MPEDRISHCVAAIAALDAALKGEIPPVPEGWFSVADFAQAKGCTNRTARELLANGVTRLKIYERKEWPNSRGSPMFIYRLKP